MNFRQVTICAAAALLAAAAGCRAHAPACNLPFEMIWRKSEWLKDRSDTECVLGLMESVGAARTPVVVSRIRQF